ncbi:unnamed protein product [Prunus armeniaca]
MDVRPTFLNGDLHEEIFMQQPLGFVERGMESMVCRLNKSIYGLKQASRQCFDMKDMGEAHFVLGIEILRDRSRCLLGLSQKSYIEKNEQMKLRPYASLVGSIMYAQVCTRPDLAFVVEKLAIYSKVEKLEIVAYTDSDLASCTDDIKYTACYVFVLAGGVVSWKSAKQTVVATSTMEAEFIGCFGAAKHAVWIKNFITKVRIVDSIAGPLKMYCDNEAVVFFSRNNKRTPASELMEIKYLPVKDKVKEQVIDVIHIGIESMVADPLTKPLPVRVFKIHVAKMGAHENFDSFYLWE